MKPVDPDLGAAHADEQTFAVAAAPMPEERAVARKHSALGFLGPGLITGAADDGVLSVPIMAVTMAMAGQPRVMDRFVLPTYLRWGGWISTTVIAAVVLGMLVMSLI